MLIVHYDSNVSFFCNAAATNIYMKKFFKCKKVGMEKK